jgi:hypothetical protein
LLHSRNARVIREGRRDAQHSIIRRRRLDNQGIASSPKFALHIKTRTVSAGHFVVGWRVVAQFGTESLAIK